MTWFRVDDSFPGHPKTRRIPRASRMAVIGTWTTLGAYSARHLTDGLIGEGDVLDEGGTRPHARALVVAGLWHPPGVGCGHAQDECPGPPPEGHYQFHDWYVYQRSREDVLAEREKKSAAGRLGGQRSGAVRRSKTGSRNEAGASAGASLLLQEVPNPRPGPARPEGSVLTLVSRLAAGDAGARVGPPPAEVVAAWQQVAGPGVDLEAEAFAYLVRYGDRPAEDERAAWLGWLRKAKERSSPATARPGCTACDGGWLGLDDELRPRPCPTCRPHLRAVGDDS